MSLEALELVNHHFLHIWLAEVGHKAISIQGVGKQTPFLDGRNGKITLQGLRVQEVRTEEVQSVLQLIYHSQQHSYEQ